MLGDPGFAPDYAAVLRLAEFPVVEIRLVWGFSFSSTILLEGGFVDCGLGLSLIMIKINAIIANSSNKRLR